MAADHFLQDRPVGGEQPHRRIRLDAAGQGRQGLVSGDDRIGRDRDRFEAALGDPGLAGLKPGTDHTGRFGRDRDHPHFIGKVSMDRFQGTPAAILSAWLPSRCLLV